LTTKKTENINMQQYWSIYCN